MIRPPSIIPAVAQSDDTRRRFIAHLAAARLSGTLTPGVLRAKVQDQGADRVTLQVGTDVSLPCHFSPVVAGTTVDRTRQPWVMSKAPPVKRPLHGIPSGVKDLITVKSVTDLPFNWNAGLAEGGTPTSVAFYAPPYRELALLALAKAYQDRMRWHERAPALA